VTEFRALRKGGVHAELPAYAAALIASLARQLIELLSDGEPQEPAGDPLEAMLDFDAPREVPDDPALRRLLPDAHRDDAEAAAEFRRFTERGLREGKVDDAIQVLRSLGADHDDLSEADESGTVEFELDREAVRAWLRCLTDLRLTLAARLEVTSGDEDYWAGLPEDDERLPVYEIYGWLGYLLESMLDVAR